MKINVQTSSRKPLALLTGVRSDSHTWNLAFLDLYLSEHGFDVLNLGATTSCDDVVRKVTQKNPDLLVVSSVNGHGLIEGREIAAALRAHSLTYLPKVIGGLLSTDPSEEASVRAALQDEGYDAVFAGPESIADFSAYLNNMENFSRSEVAL